jgi:hypothetical protein
MDTPTEKQGADAAATGVKLAAFIAALPISDEEKQAFVTVVESASYEELLQLEAAFEERYIQEKTKGVDGQLQKDLTQIKKEGDATEQKLADEFAEKLKAIEKKIS